MNKPIKLLLKNNMLSTPIIPKEKMSNKRQISIKIRKLKEVEFNSLKYRLKCHLIILIEP